MFLNHVFLVGALVSSCLPAFVLGEELRTLMRPFQVQACPFINLYFVASVPTLIHGCICVPICLSLSVYNLST